MLRQYHVFCADSSGRVSYGSGYPSAPPTSNCLGMGRYEFSRIVDGHGLTEGSVICFEGRGGGWLRITSIRECVSEYENVDIEYEWLPDVGTYVDIEVNGEQWSTAMQRKLRDQINGR